MRFGYARVSKGKCQDPAPQVAALKEAGCDRVYVDQMTGSRWDRPELLRLLDHLRADDVLVVWKLDRLGRSLKDLLILLEKVNARGAGFQSLTESIDTTSASGRMVMAMLGAFAEFEWEMIRERTRAGLDHARSEGRTGGGRPKLTSRQQREVIEMVESGRGSGADAARLFCVSESTISRILARHRQQPSRP